MPYVLRENEVIFTGDVLVTDRSLQRWNSIEIDTLIETPPLARLRYYDIVESTHNVPDPWGAQQSQAAGLQQQSQQANAYNWGGQYYVMPTSYGNWTTGSGIGGATLTYDSIQEAVNRAVNSPAPVYETPIDFGSSLINVFSPQSSRQKKRKLNPYRFKKGEAIKMRKDIFGIGIPDIKCTILKQYENNMYDSAPTYELMPIDKKLAKAYGPLLAIMNNKQQCNFKK